MWTTTAPASRRPSATTSSAHSTGSATTATRTPAILASASPSPATSPAATAGISPSASRPWAACGRRCGCRCRADKPSVIRRFRDAPVHYQLRFNPPYGQWPRSEVPRLGGRRLPVVVAPIGVAHGGACELPNVHIVEASNINGVKVAAEDIEVAAAEGVHAAVTAEQVVHAVGAELVVRERCLIRQQAERLGLEHDAPVAGLGANRAIALAGARAEVDLRLEA